MKNLIILIAFTLITLTGYSSTKTAVNSGPWTSSNTWNNNVAPVSGDNVIIPLGITVQINNNMNIGSTTYFIQIFGTLQFVGGGAKLAINAASSIYVFGTGIIDGSNSPSQTISIGSNQVYNAGTQNIVSGPSDANSATPGFIPFTTLPVKFVSFSTNIASSTDVLVKWTTTEEVNANRFEVERSIDGSNWKTIGSVTAIGKGTETTDYSYSDRNVNESVVYYRIKEIDVNGTYYFSLVENVKGLSVTGSDIKISAAGHNVIFQFSKEVKNQVTVRFISFSGQILSQQTINQPIGQVIINANSSLRGNYIVSVSNNQGVNTAKEILL